MAPLGTAPHRVAPGVWATQDGRRLTPAGSAYWEHHHQQGLVTADGHTTQKARSRAFGAAIDPTRPVLPAAPPPRAAPGQPTITRGQWAGMTPKQKMATQVTVTLTPKERAHIAKLRKQQAVRPKPPPGYRYASPPPVPPPVPKKVNQAIGFGGASGIDTHMAALAAAEAAFAAQRSKFDTLVKAGGLSPQKADEAARYNLAHPKHGGFLSHTGLPAIAHGLEAGAHLGQAAIEAGGMRVGHALGIDQLTPWHPPEQRPLGPIPGGIAEPLARTGAVGTAAGRIASENYFGPNLTALATGGHFTPGGLALDAAFLIPGLKPIRGARAALRAARGAHDVAGVARVAEGAARAVADIPERQGLLDAWKQSGFTDDQVNRVAAFYDNQAHHYRAGPEAWWRHKVGARTGETPEQLAARRTALFQGAHIPETPQAARLRVKARTAKFKATDADVNAATQLPRNAEGLSVLYPEGVHTPPMGRMPRIKGMTPQLWDLIKRGAPYRDWYERGAGVIERFAARQGLTNRQAAAIVAITSQSANPTFNLKRAAEMVGEYKTLGRIEPSTRFAGQAEKVTHVLEHPETFNWDGVKTNNYFANFIHHLDPAFHAQLYGKDTQVTVDRHIANMILGKKSVTEAQSNEVGDLFVRTAKNLGWSPKEVQAAAWVPWKAEQMDITQTLKVLSKQMAKRGEIPAELLGKGKKISEKRTAFVRAAYEGGRHPEDHIPKGWEHYKHTAADAYGRGERMYSGEYGGTLYQHGARPASELPKGATELLKDGSRVHHWQSGDVSTAMHELLHVSIHDLKGRHLDTLANEYAGGKALADWTDAEHEALASAFEQWIRTGEITNKKLIGPFNAIKQWMINLLPKARAEGMVPKDVEDAFNYMFREQPPVKLEEQVVAAAKRAPSVYDVQGVKRSLDLSERVGKMTAADAEAGGGIAGQRAQLEALRGEYHKEPFDDLTHLNEDDLDFLAHSVAATNLKPLQKVTLVKGIEAAQKGEVFTPSLTRLALRAFAPGEPLAKRTARETAAWLINEIVNIPRSIMASGDASGAFRQALVAFALHPVMVSKEMGPMFKFLASEKAYLKNQEFLASDPLARLMAAHGTDFTDVHHGFENREEQFTSSFAEWLTGGKHGLVRRSGRAYTGLLNNVRYAMNKDMYRIAAKQNIDLGTQELRDISTVANWATGRGHLGGLETQKMLLNTFLFSPRLLKSRLDMLNPFFYRRLTPIARRQAQRATAQLVLGGVAVLGMAKLSGVDVGIDPFSSDFGKMKIGNHRFDIWGGHQQIVRTIAQEMFGKKTKVTTGETLGISRGLPTLNFARGKLSPPIGLFVDKATGSTIVGDPLTWKGVLWNHLSPLGAQDAVEAYQDKGGNENSIPWGLGAFAAAFMGVGAQTIPNKAQGSSSGYKPPSVSSSGGYQPPSLSGGGGYQPP